MARLFEILFTAVEYRRPLTSFAQTPVPLGKGPMMMVSARIRVG
jgi:hypothetical protein